MGQLNSEFYILTSCRAGIQAAEELKPAAILLDIGILRISGYETDQLLRQQPWGGNRIVVLLSGYGQREDLQWPQAAGFDYTWLSS